MFPLLRSTSLLFRMHLSSVFWSKRALLCMILASAPPVLAWIVLHFDPDTSADQVGGFLAWTLVLQVVVPVLALVAGSAVLTEEIESRTITFVFTRPVPRAALLYGRWLATLVLVCGILAASTSIMAQMVSRAPLLVEEAVDPNLQSFNRPGRDGEWARRHRERQQERLDFESAHPTTEQAALVAPMMQRFVWAAVLGGAVYSLLFAVFGVFLRHPMIFGLGYTFAFEGVLANLPGETQSLSIQFYLRSILIDERLWVFHRLYPYEMTGFPNPYEATRVLSILMLVALVVGGWAIGRRQYVLTA